MQRLELYETGMLPWDIEMTVEALHSALDGSRRDGHTARTVLFIDMLVDKAVRNDLSLNTRVVRSVVHANNLINDTIRRG